MKKSAFKQVAVVDSQRVTPNMQRLFLQDVSLADFPADCEGSYIKFLFNELGGTDLSMINEGERPVMRTYTVRRFTPLTHTIEVDFVLHATQDLHSGFATRWAMTAAIGDTVNIGGPGNIKEINTNADWFLMAADMTALPALSANIRLLPSNAKGYAVIKVVNKEDAQMIEAPTQMQVIWLNDGESLTEKVKLLPWLNGTASIWTACEFEDMRELRAYYRNDKLVDREYLYISSYWKKGVTEDGHKVLKQQDAQETQL